MKKNLLKDYAIIAFSVTLMSIGIYFFKFPNHFSFGGVSGLAIVVVKIFPRLSPSFFVSVMNIVLLVLGFMVFGKDFGAKTAFASVLSSIQLSLLEIIYPMKAPFTTEPLLELIFAVMLPAIASAILFNMRTTSGGTDVIAMILKKYTALNIGNALLASDIFVVIACFFVFDIQVGLFSVLGLAIKSLMVDNIIESFNLNKYFTIITSKHREVCEFIVKELHRGATETDAKGAFTDSDKKIILTVMNRRQALLLQNHIRKVDANAFVMITNTSEIIGKGFRDIL